MLHTNTGYGNWEGINGDVDCGYVYTTDPPSYNIMCANIYFLFFFIFESVYFIYFPIYVTKGKLC